MIDNIPFLTGNAVVVADVDGDGRNDLLIARNSEIYTLFNNAYSEYSATSLSMPNSAFAFACADVDNDGDLDILSLNVANDAIDVYRNNGRGVFTPGSTVTVGDYPYAIVVSDLDGDGDVDFAVSNRSSSSVSIGRNNGTGVFSVSSTLPNPTPEPVAVAVTDLDGDGDLDLLSTSATGMGVWRNNGFGGFTPMAPVANTGGTAVVCADIDNDGDIDFVVASPDDNLVRVRLNNDAFMVTAVSPARNAAAGPPAANVQLTFNKNVNAATANRARIWGQQRGGKKFGLSTTNANVVSFNPTTDFAPGELVNVTVPTTILSTGGDVARHYVYQFTAAATGGQATFTDVFHATNSGSAVQAVTTADVNNDGNLDLLEFNQSAGGVVMLHLGTGTGTFGAGVVVSNVAVCLSIATADLDNDGDLDLLVADRPNNVVKVHLNAGAGVFGPATNVSVGTLPAHIVTGDVDGDGDLDFVAASGGGGSVRFNNGSGGFSGAGSAGLTGFLAAGLGDLDGDGDLDVVTVSNASAYVRFNNGSGVFSGGYTVNVGVVPANASANGVLLGDLDGDGDLDLAVNNQGENFTAIRLNDGAGLLSGTLNVPSGNNGYEAALGDLDGDGDLDIVVANSGGSSAVLLNNGDATFAAGTPAPTTTAFAIALGDVDNDGDLDILNTDDDGSAVQVLLNQNAFTVTARAPERHTTTTPTFGDVNLTLSEAINPLTASQLRVFGTQSSGRKGGISAGVGTSLTLDPNVDFAPGEEVSVTARATIKSVGNAKSLRPHVYQFRAKATGGTGTFVPAPDVAVGTSATLVTTGDVNGDGNLDLIAVSLLDENANIRPGNGDGTFGAGTDVAIGAKPGSVTLADVNADGRLDLLVTNFLAGTVSIRLNTGGAFPNLTTATGIPQANKLTAADIDGDGDLDLLVSSSSTNAIHVRFNDGAGVFSGTGFVTSGLPGNVPNDLDAADVDNDGDLDLIVANFTDRDLSVHFNNGSGAFGAGTHLSTGPVAKPRGITVGDVDADGDLDLIVTHESVPTLGVYRNNGMGGFGAATVYATGLTAFDPALADVDGDGDLDLLIPHFGEDQVRLLLNDGSGTFAAGAPIAATNSPQMIAVGDFDNDGDLDFAAVNSLNSLLNIRLNAAVAGPAPTIATFTPDHGVTGTVVTLTGTNFTGTTGVTFDGVAAPGFVVNGAGTTITVSSPPATFNGVIAVTTPDGVASTATDFGVDLVISAAELIPVGDFHHITVTATGVATLGGPVEATAPVLVQTGGELADGGAVLSGAGSFTLEAGATLRLRNAQGLNPAGALQLSGGLTLASDATYIYQSPLAQVTGTNLPAEVRNLTIASPTGVTLTQPVNIRQVLTVAGAGNFVLNGKAVTLLSDAAGTALVANTGAGRVVGTVTAQVWLSDALNAGLDYRHISAPTSNAAVADLLTPGFAPLANVLYNTAENPLLVKPYPNIYGFDETRLPISPNFISGYYSPTNVASPLSVGVGYTAYIKGGLTPDFVGPLTQDDVVRAGLTRTGNGVKSGWHLIGNPFPSPLDWDLVTVPAGLSQSISVYQSTGVNAGVYLTRANGLGNLADGVIPMGQAFFAQVATAPVNLTLPSVARVTAYGSAAHYRVAADARPAVHLTLRAVGASAAETDGSVVYFQEGATAEADRDFDGARPAPNAGLATLSSLTAAGTQLAVNGLPASALTTGTTVELLLALPAAGAYELAVARIANLPTTDAVLLDRLTNTRYALAEQPTIRVAASNWAAVRGRFALVFGAAKAGAAPASLSVWPNPARGAVQVAGATAGAAITVFDAVGRVVLTATADAAGATVLPEAKLPPGVYVVRTGVQTQRLVVE